MAGSIVRRCIFAVLGIAILGGLPSDAGAVDGVVLITQNTVLAAGGFPYHINVSGSYRLASNLVVPDANTTAISMDVDSVTLDLNGFAIIGPTRCGGTPFACSPIGTGNGIAGNSNRNLTVRNGTVQGMGNIGVGLNSGNESIDHVHALMNGGGGLLVSGGLITDSTAELNGVFGLDGGGVVSHNEVIGAGSGNVGISGIFALVTGNNVIMNDSTIGLSLDRSGYSDNVVNVGAGTPVMGGVSLGHNLCNGSLC